MANFQKTMQRAKRAAIAKSRRDDHVTVSQRGTGFQRYRYISDCQTQDRHAVDTPEERMLIE